MSRSLIQTANQSTQAVEANSIINLGSVQRRYGCNLRLSGNGVEVSGEGYYVIDGTISVSPTAAGAVTVAAFSDGVQIPGVIAYGYAETAEQPVTLPLVGTIRETCCSPTNNITLMLLEGAGNVENVSFRIKKE